MPALEESVSGFFGRPSEFLRDVMAGLDTDAQAALGLVFVNHDWLPSPVTLSPRDEDLIAAPGATSEGVTKSFGTFAGASFTTSCDGATGGSSPRIQRWSTHMPISSGHQSSSTTCSLTSHSTFCSVRSLAGTLGCKAP